MNVENRFFQLVTDLEQREKTPDSYSDLLNARPFHMDGEGRVVTELLGMTVAFQVTTGFRPIGLNEYNGVLYMVLFNAGTNQVEFGSYPSPNYTECSGWIKEYQPFNNYTANTNYNSPTFVQQCAAGYQNVPKTNLRVSNHFGWGCERRLDVFLRESYDGSLSMYIAHGDVPNIVVNTGFHHDTGNCLDRFVSNADIVNGNLVQFNESGTLPIIGLVGLGADGQLAGGNYFFFVRYSNQNRATTSFVLPSRPVSVPGSPQSGTAGLPNTYGVGKDEQTNHSVTLNLLGLDTSYQTFQIGYVYFADGFNQSYLIDQVYYVNAQANQQVTITGYESRSVIETEELLMLKPFEKACRTHTEVNNVYYGANWKGRVLHHPDLCEFAKNVVIGEYKLLMGEHEIDYVNAPTNGAYNGFDTEKQVFENVGYFSGETYCFHLVPLFNNGSIGLSYPMTGTDNYTGVPVGTNEKGIYRFSSAQADPFVDADNRIYSKQARFDFSGTTATPWILENVKKWIVVRAERRPNLLYQGLAIPAFDGKIISEDHFYWNNFKVEDISWTTQRWAPLVEGCDYFFLRDGTGDERREIRYGWSNPVGQGVSMRQPESRKEGMYGIFSLDYMVDNAKGGKLPNGATVVRIGNHATPDRIANNGDSVPVFKDGNFHQVGWYWHDWDFTGPLETKQVQLYDVNAWDYSANNGFVSRFDNGSEPIGNGYYWIQEGEAGTDDIFLNMPMAMPAYIGMSGWDGSDIANNLVNVYRSDPALLDINTVYDNVNEFFYPISVQVQADFSIGLIVGGGDCFTQRTHLKTIHAVNNFDEDLTGFIAESGTITKNIENGYGTMVSFVCENRHNAAFRVQKEGNKFFPATGLNDIGSFAYLYNQPETPFVNNGYQQVLPPRALRGFDPNQFYGDEHYKTRIRHTNPQVIAGQLDSYRNSGIQQVRDFDLQYGSINRLVEDLNRLYSFQERAINLHPINERATSETTEGNRVITGQVLGLTDYVDRLSDRIGLQHSFAVVKGISGIHGIDADRRVWWRVRGNSVELLSIQKGCDSLIRNTIEAYGANSDICGKIPDNPVCNLGIHAVHDRKNKEIVVTFLLGSQGDTDLRKTIVFSEKDDVFTHRTSFYPYMYGTINDELYSFSGQDLTNRRGWLHDQNQTRNNFYGLDFLGQLSFYVNVQGNLEKAFHQQVINSGPVSLFIIEWTTEDQRSTLVIASAPFWWAPEYKNRGWHQPIPEADTIVNSTNSTNGIGSQLTGRWMLTRLIFNTRGGLDIRDVQTLITEVKQ